MPRAGGCESDTHPRLPLTHPAATPTHTGSGKTTLLSQLSVDYARQGVNTLWGRCGPLPACAVQCGAGTPPHHLSPPLQL